MNRSTVRRCLLWFSACLFLTSWHSSYGQESNRTVDSPGVFHKYLTPTVTDRWTFQGKANQTIIVIVTTTEFDAVVELVSSENGNETVMLELDDEGSDCNFKYRLNSDGEYKVRVHGFENKGGGEYRFEIKQFQAAPMEWNVPVDGILDNSGKAYFYFSSQNDSFASLQTLGVSSVHSQFLDTKGSPCETWTNLIACEKDGEHLLELNGTQGTRFQVVLRSVPQLAFSDGVPLNQNLPTQGSCIFEIDGREGLFRVIEIESSKKVASRVVFAPRKKVRINLLRTEQDLPPLQLIPIGSKGLFTRYAVFFGRNERYQLQLSSVDATSAKVAIKDVLVAVANNQTVKEQLAVGSTRFFQVKREQGKSLIARAESTQFDIAIELIDSIGKRIKSNDDGGDGLNSQITEPAYKDENAILAVASVGNGGGGEFQLTISTKESKIAEVGKKYAGKCDGETDEWILQGVEGDSVVILVQAKTAAPSVKLLNASGVMQFNAMAKASTLNTVFVFDFPKTEKYSMIIELPAGSDYQLSLFDPKQ